MAVIRLFIYLFVIIEFKLHRPECIHIVMGIPDVRINIKVLKTHLKTKKNISVIQYNIVTIRLFGITINYGL